MRRKIKELPVTVAYDNRVNPCDQIKKVALQFGLDPHTLPKDPSIPYHRYLNFMKTMSTVSATDNECYIYPSICKQYSNKIYFAYRCLVGEVPDLVEGRRHNILHTCFNVLCMNPHHMQMCNDQIRSHRMFERERANNKLTMAQKQEIRDLVETGELTQKAIAEIYNVTQPNICYLAKRSMDAWHNGAVPTQTDIERRNTKNAAIYEQLIVDYDAEMSIPQLMLKYKIKNVQRLFIKINRARKFSLGLKPTQPYRDIFKDYICITKLAHMAHTSIVNVHQMIADGKLEGIYSDSRYKNRCTLRMPYAIDRIREIQEQYKQEYISQKALAKLIEIPVARRRIRAYVESGELTALRQGTNYLFKMPETLETLKALIIRDTTDELSIKELKVILGTSGCILRRLIRVYNIPHRIASGHGGRYVMIKPEQVEKLRLLVERRK